MNESTVNSPVKQKPLRDTRSWEEGMREDQRQNDLREEASFDEYQADQWA